MTLTLLAKEEAQVAFQINHLQMNKKIPASPL
jgi:hypothetical protein